MAASRRRYARTLPSRRLRGRGPVPACDVRSRRSGGRRGCCSPRAPRPTPCRFRATRTTRHRHQPPPGPPCRAGRRGQRAGILGQPWADPQSTEAVGSRGAYSEGGTAPQMLAACRDGQPVRRAPSDGQLGQLQVLPSYLTRDAWRPHDRSASVNDRSDPTMACRAGDGLGYCPLGVRRRPLVGGHVRSVRPSGR